MKLEDSVSSQEFDDAEDFFSVRSVFSRCTSFSSVISTTETTDKANLPNRSSQFTLPLPPTAFPFPTTTASRQALPSTTAPPARGPTTATLPAPNQQPNQQPNPRGVTVTIPIPQGGHGIVMVTTPRKATDSTTTKALAHPDPQRGPSKQGIGRGKLYHADQDSNNSSNTICATWDGVIQVSGGGVDSTSWLVHKAPRWVPACPVEAGAGGRVRGREGEEEEAVLLDLDQLPGVLLSTKGGVLSWPEFSQRWCPKLA